MDRHIAPLERRGEMRSDPEDMHHQAALLIDFDNVTMGIRSNLGQELRNLLNSDMIRGKVAVQRAYADWRRYPQYIVPLSEASIDLIFAPAYGSSKKNATDIRLAIDALELVFVRPEIRTYILMSGDSDFSSLVLKLKEYGKYVIGVGIQESSSDLLVQNCDEYYSYSALSGLSKTSDQVIESHDPWLLVAKAVEKMVERGDTMRSDRLKQVMLEIDPSFNEKEHGCNKFNRFVVQAASKGLVSIQKMENGQYGVAPGDREQKGREEKPARSEKRESKGSRGGGRRQRERGGAKPAVPAVDEQEKPGGAKAAAREPERKAAQSTGRAREKATMESALALLQKALGVLLEGESGSVRDSDVKRRMLELDPDFDEGELGYSKFSKFLQAAEERRAIDLERGPNGNYHVSLPSSGERRAPSDDDAERVAAGESTMKRLARFFFGAGQTEPAAAPQTERPPQAERAEEAAAERRGRRGARDSARESGRAARPGAGEGAEGAGTRSRSETRSHSEARAGRAEGRGDHPRGGRGRRGGSRSPRKSEAESAPAKASGPPAGRVMPERAATEERAASTPRRETEPAAEPSPPERREAEPSVASGPSSERQPASEAQPPAAEATQPATEANQPATEASQPAAEATQPAAEASQPAAESREAAVTAAPLPGAPRGTIRGRWGTRGRYRPAPAPPPIFAGQTRSSSGTQSESRPAAAGGGEGTEGDAILAHLTAYPGVGGKTAQALVDAFGADTFRVLDEEPDRVRTVLPDHRADRVIEARREERAAGGN